MTAAMAAIDRRASPKKNRNRVSSQVLCQSMSVLHRYGVEKDVLECRRHHFGRDRLPCARFVEHGLRAGAREDAQHPSMALRPDDALRARRDGGRFTIEEQADVAIPFPDVVEDALDLRAPAVNDGDAIRN